MPGSTTDLLRRVAPLLVACASWIATAEAQSPPPPTVMLVFDGSGSMWGRLEGDRQAKFVTAREALKPLLSKADPNTQFGLTAFGSRRQGDCTDAYVAVPPETGGDKISALLDRYNPKGKGPITLGLREAIRALPKAAGPRSLIVIHDDLDNCGLDPCAALADLQAGAPDARVYVLGLGIRAEDAQKLQCLAGPTGGKVLDAQTPPAVAAGLEELMRLALAAPAAPAPAQRSHATPAATVVAPPQAPVAPVPAVGQRRALRPDGPPALRLATVLANGQPPRTSAAHFVVRRSADPDGAPPVFSGRGQDILLPLAAGSYVVEASDGLMPAKREVVTVPAKGQLGVDIVLDAGLVRMPASAASPQSAMDAMIGFFEAGPDGRAGAPRGLFPEVDIELGLALPPGAWVVRYAEGAARLEKPVDVKPGEVVELARAWPFGRLQVTVTGAPDVARSPVLVTVYEDDPDAPRGRREVARSAATSPVLALPAGTYTLIARQGTLEARDRFVLQGGTVLQRSLALAGARLSLTSRLAGAPSALAAIIADEPIAYRIERLDVVPAEVFTANRPTAEFGLPAGRYRIEARHGLVNARTSREITLSAGDNVSVSLDQPAGAVKLVGPARAAGDHLWEVLDETGYPLWSTAQPSPRATLLAGRYVIRLEYRDKRIDRRIEVKAGEIRTIEIAE